jgi:C4-dicarboxylate-specific signal transduction histidine kinase
MIPQASPVDVAIFFGTLVIVSAVVAISMAGQRMAMQIYILFTMLPVSLAIGLNVSIEERTLGLGMGIGAFILISVGRHANHMARRELKTAADRARFEERRHLSEQIAQLDRQRSLGELSASLGHELIQPLTAILTNAQVVQRGLQSGRFDTQQHTEFNSSIILNTKRAAEIIERIRTFIRPSAMRLEPVDLREVAHDVASLVASDVRRNKVMLDLAGCEPGIRVMGDPIQLSQIVLNVFRNALDAMGQSTERQLRVFCTSVDGRAILRVNDTGPGLSPDALAKVGTPFFTTKTAGLGMGVSISRSIAAQHGGSLTLANAAQGGCVAVLNLPAIAATSPYAS